MELSGKQKERDELWIIVEWVKIFFCIDECEEIHFWVNGVEKKYA